MDGFKENIRAVRLYVVTFLKWVAVSLVIGALGGCVGTVFHMLVDGVTEFRTEHGFIIYLLPLGGVIIAGMYKLFSTRGRLDTNRVIEAVREDTKIPLVMLPLIFISTVITHLLGGSAGREGAALQIGGSIGYNIGRLFRLNERNMHIIIMAGMSSVFSALFGTPVTAAVFALEVISVGVLNYAGLLPCAIASAVAYGIAVLSGVEPVRFTVSFPDAVSADMMVRVAVLSLLLVVVSIIFLTAVKKCEHYMDRLIKYSYLRAFAGGVIIVALTLVIGSRDYNGAGMDVIAAAIAGNARPEAFIVKIIFTAITIAAGFKGGEIVPTFFIGSTFGCAVAGLLGIDGTIAAAIGFIALFCCVVNCPLASLLLAAEVFGGEGMVYFAVACAICYMMSGCFGLYKSQKIVYSKLDAEYIDKNAI